MDTSIINGWAVLVAGLSCFFMGAIWYAPPVFGKAWMRENGFTEEGLKKDNMAMIFGWAFVLGLFASFNLAMFLGKETDALMGAFYGFLAGFGWVAMFLGIFYLFERRSFTLFLINGGYATVTMTLMGWILGAWK